MSMQLKSLPWAIDIDGVEFVFTARYEQNGWETYYRVQADGHVFFMRMNTDTLDFRIMDQHSLPQSITRRAGLIMEKVMGVAGAVV